MVIARGLFCFGVVCLVAILTSGHGRETPAQRLALYHSWHEVCLDGDVRVIDGKIDEFEARLATDPHDHLARAFLGSACALRAKAGMWGPTKLKFLKRGGKLMDEAVAAAPKDPRVRMVRAIAYYRVPKRFKKRATSLADFRLLIPVAKHSRGGLDVCERQAILYYASQAFAEEGLAEAVSLRALCHRLDPHSSYGQKTK